MSFFREWQWKLYPNYLTWCKSTGCEAVTLTRFSGLLVDLLKNSLHIDVIKQRDAPGVYIQGIKLDAEHAPGYWESVT